MLFNDLCNTLLWLEDHGVKVLSSITQNTAFIFVFGKVEEIQVRIFQNTCAVIANIIDIIDHFRIILDSGFEGEGWNKSWHALLTIAIDVSKICGILALNAANHPANFVMFGIVSKGVSSSLSLLKFFLRGEQVV